MDSSEQRRSQSIGNILKVTNNIIQENENFHDYYINKDNSLYYKQLPLLVRKSNLQNALVLYSKENKKQSNYSLSLDKGHVILDNIRNAQIRSKKLPPLCPFYNEKGELVPSIVKTSKVYNNHTFDNNEVNNNTSIRGRRNKLILKKIWKKNGFENNKTSNDYENIETDYFKFNEEGYDTLIYGEKEIFRKKDYYLNMINEKIVEFKIKGLKDANKEFQKVKIFEKSIKKKKVTLTLDSICIQIFSSDKGEDNTNQVPVFEYNLPFVFLPLFYFKGEEKFKIIISKLIDWDNVNKKFILNENQENIIQDILKNCSDFETKIKQKEKQFDKLKTFKLEDSSNKQSRVKFNSGTNKSTKLKKDFLTLKSMASVPIKDDHGYSQTIAGQIPNTYLTNIEGENNNKYNVKDRKEIYPIEKENNYFIYNIFEFLWLTPEQIFTVSIKMPLITINVPDNNIIVKKYVDFDLLFFLYQNDFKYWDFYLTKYLTSFKSFRTLLEDINSINEISNKKLYLTYPKIKTYSFNNIKFVNIASIKHKDILENLIDGLMSGSEEKKENKAKTDINKENNDNTDGINNQIEPKEQPIQISKEEDKLQTSTLIQKSFIAIIRFVDNKTLIAKEYKIYFNFSQFQKFQKLDKFIDKISFLIKFIDINYIHQTVSINYKSLNNFNENEWIKDFERYNSQYLNSLNNIQKDNQKVFTEFSGITKNTSIQIEIYRPLSLFRTLGENGSIKTEKNILGNNSLEKTINIEKEDVKEMSKIFYDNFTEEEKNPNTNK